MTTATAVEQHTAPTSVDEVGVDLGVLADIVLKILYFGGNVAGGDICQRLALPLSPTLEILDFLKRERLCEVTGGNGQSPATLRFSLTSSGLERAVAALAVSGYVGPAPVPLEAYLQQVRQQSIQNVELSRQAIEASLSHLVLEQRTLDLIGQAISSKRAVLLYGASGNGKSTAADGLRQALPGHILIPHAIEVMHQIIQVYDPATHEAVDGGHDGRRAPRTADRRWIVIKRPAVYAAGELAASHLELVLDEVHKTYEAPIQMKANGGLLVIDDFGRQRLDAAYLLNRWIVPLERGIDNLSLHNGARFQVPFDVIPLFLTNRPPTELADEAFLRRIRYKIEIPSPDSELFLEILKRECQRNEVAYDQTAAQHLLEEYFLKAGREMRGCHPRDIVEAIAARARYRGTTRTLTPATIDSACANYFV